MSQCREFRSISFDNLIAHLAHGWRLRGEGLPLVLLIVIMELLVNVFADLKDFLLVLHCNFHISHLDTHRVNEEGLRESAGAIDNKEVKQSLPLHPLKEAIRVSEQ